MDQKKNGSPRAGDEDGGQRGRRESDPVPNGLEGTFFSSEGSSAIDPAAGFFVDPWRLAMDQRRVLAHVRGVASGALVYPAVNCTPFSHRVKGCPWAEAFIYHQAAHEDLVTEVQRTVMAGYVFTSQPGLAVDTNTY